jgi:hypothetical protein
MMSTVATLVCPSLYMQYLLLLPRQTQRLIRLNIYGIAMYALPGSIEGMAANVN